jgi:seryl-tRNA(Sec) selenium transferase
MINATGVLMHTELGRAPLSAAAREAVRAATGCTDVEFDLVLQRQPVIFESAVVVAAAGGGLVGAAPV